MSNPHTDHQRVHLGQTPSPDFAALLPAELPTARPRIGPDLTFIDYRDARAVAIKLRKRYPGWRIGILALARDLGWRVALLDDGFTAVEALISVVLVTALLAIGAPTLARLTAGPERDPVAEVRWAVTLARAGNATRIDANLVSWTRTPTGPGQNCALYDLASTATPLDHHKYLICDE